MNRHRDSAQYCPWDAECSPDERCSRCLMALDYERNKDFYKALGEYPW